MQKKINEFINTSITTSAAFLVIGLILLIFPGLSLDLLRIAIALFFIISGAISLSTSFEKKSAFPFSGGTTSGAISLIVGLVFMVYPGVLNIIPIIIGAWFIISALIKLKMTSAMGNTQTSAFFTAIISLVCGLILIIYASASATALTAVAGAIMVVYSLMNIIDMSILKSNVKKISKDFKKAKEEIKKNLDGIQEAEEVKPKKEKK